MYYLVIIRLLWVNLLPFLLFELVFGVSLNWGTTKILQIIIMFLQIVRLVFLCKNWGTTKILQIIIMFLQIVPLLVFVAWKITLENELYLSCNNFSLVM